MSTDHTSWSTTDIDLPMNAAFHARFASVFRGSPEEITRRQAVYLPLLASLRDLFPDGTLLDLGCGRGEWLELVAAAGWQAIGVETDVGKQAFTTEAGLKVHRAEALAYLQGLPAGSQAVVTAFHLAEHLSFADLGNLIAESHRVLRPGGLLILETPNPENLSVGACSFYSDPTHRAPLPPDLLRFLVEVAGFVDCRVLRLNRLPIGELPPDFSLVGVLFGVSPDYSVLARKQTDVSCLAPPLPLPLEAENRSLLETAAAFDQGLHAVLGRQAGDIEALKWQQREGMAMVEGHTGDIETLKAQQRENQANLLGELDRLAAATRQYQEELRLIYASRSWRWTAPYRRLMGLLRTAARQGKLLFHAARGEAATPRALARRVYRSCPRLGGAIRKISTRLPWLHNRIRRYLWADERIAGGACTGRELEEVSGGADLSPEAMRILADIQRAGSGRERVAAADAAGGKPHQ